MCRLNLIQEIISVSQKLNTIENMNCFETTNMSSSTYTQNITLVNNDNTMKGIQISEQLPTLNCGKLII